MTADDTAVFYSVMMLLHPLFSIENIIGVFIDFQFEGGNHFAFYAHLSVMDNSYGKFRELLEYKLTWRGKKLVRVDRFFPSSKKCCKCGSVKKELKLSDRVYLCRCGNRIDRDLNAAINIREEARRMLLAG